MRYLLTRMFAMGLVCVASIAVRTGQTAGVADKDRALLAVDRAAFPPGSSTVKLKEDLLDPDFTWTDSSGNTQDKSEFFRDLMFEVQFAIQAEGGTSGQGGLESVATGVHDYGQVGIVQERSGKVYILRVWAKRDATWRLLIYQAVSIGAPPSAESGTGVCDNPCNTVPFQPRSDNERDVIRTYQAVERAVTAHDSAAWGAHIADEFFAVTSNSDRPLDKASRMAGLDNRKGAGIAPFPLVSARMFKFGDAMVMTSRQQPERGLPLHVTRVWFKRKGAWVEAYSYQTTIQPADSAPKTQ